MKPEVMATYLKWGHRRNRTILTTALFAAMCVSITLQGIDFFQVFDNGESPDSELLSQKPSDSESLKPDDFELLFGFNEKPETKAQTAEIPKTRLNLVLRGAMSNLDQKQPNASAIIQGSNQDKLYVIGDPLPGGVTLKEVHSDHVVLSRNGQLETLYFPDMGSDSRSLQEYKSPVPEAPEPNTKRPGYTQQPDGKSLEERMQELRDKLQQANQGIQ